MRAAASGPPAAAAARGSSSPSRSLTPGAPSPRAALGAARRRSHVLFFPGPAASCSPPPTSPQSRVPRPPPRPASRSPRFASPSRRGALQGEVRGSRPHGLRCRRAAPRLPFQVEPEPGAGAHIPFGWRGSGRERFAAPPARLRRRGFRSCHCLRDPDIMLGCLLTPSPFCLDFPKCRERERTILWDGVY